MGIFNFRNSDETKMIGYYKVCPTCDGEQGTYGTGGCGSVGICITCNGTGKVIDLLPLQLWLAKQLPEEIYVMLSKFYKRKSAKIQDQVTDWEWDYIVLRVEEKLTYEQCLRHQVLLSNECASQYSPIQALRWSWHKPWPARTAALIQILP